MNKIAVVTGSLKGLGFATARELVKEGYEIVITGRDADRGREAVEKLNGEGHKAHFLLLDVSSPEDIERFSEKLIKTFGRVDVLINNAGIYKWGEEEPKGAAAEAEAFTKIYQTNTVGPFLLCERIVPLMIKQGFGRVVNVSSGMGQLSAMGNGSPAYRLSKTAMNAVTTYFSYQTRGKNILINSVCPGWVRTDMGGPSAHRSIEEGVSGIVWAATLPEDGPNGGFFRDGKRLDF